MYASNNDSNNKDFGIWFSKLREESGFESQRQLALKSGVSPTTISRIESGIQKAEPKTLQKLALYLKISFEELMQKAGYLPENFYVKEDQAKYKVTKKDLSEYKDFIKHAGAFFKDDKVAEEDKERLFRDISELFWESKEINKEKYGRKNKKE